MINIEKLLAKLRERRDDFDRHCDDDTLCMYKDIAVVQAIEVVIEAIELAQEQS